MKRKQTYKIALFALSIVGMVVFAGAEEVHAQEANPQQTCDSLGVKNAFSFILGNVNGSGSGENRVARYVVCCCDGAYISENTAREFQNIRQCPAACETINIAETERGDIIPEPGDDNLKLDDATRSPLVGVSAFVSQWYSVLFYIALIAAILQVFRGGFEYAIAAGNASKTEEAKSIIIEAVIGLGIILLAAGILVFLRGTQVFNFT